MRTSIKRRGGICIVVEEETQSSRYSRETNMKKASVKIKYPALQCQCTNDSNKNKFTVKKKRIGKFWNNKNTCQVCTRENFNTETNLVGEFLLDY